MAEIRAFRGIRPAAGKEADIALKEAVERDLAPGLGEHECAEPAPLQGEQAQALGARAVGQLPLREAAWRGGRREGAGV